MTTSGESTIVVWSPTSGKVITPVSGGQLIIDHLERLYPDGFKIETDLHLGSVCENTKLEPKDCSDVLKSGDVLHIVHRPSGFDPLTIAIAAVIAVIAVVALTPKPEIPNFQGETVKESPNNDVKGQTNVARPYQAIPEIYGRIVAFPDLAQPSIFEYIDNRKIVREVFVLGVGEYEEHAVKEGETLIDNIPGAGYTKYEPFTVPSDLIVGRTTNEINGQELLATNEREPENPDGWIGFFELSGQGEQVWLHFQFPRGLRTEGGDSISINYQVEIREVGTANVTAHNFSISARTVDPQFRTHKIDLPSSTADYEVRARRTSSSPGGANLDQIRFEDAVSVQSYFGAGFGDVTTYDVRTQATQFALSSSQLKFNVETTRRLETWNETDGLVTSREPTRKFADAILHVLTSSGRSLSEIDLDSLYGIQNNLSHEELGFFDYSFDDEDISLGKRIQTICNACRVGVYRDGQVFRFFREEAKPKTMMFNRRNIRIGSGQNQSYQFQKPMDFDSVSIRYIDPVTNRRRQVNRRIDGERGIIINGVTGLRTNEIDLAGCRNARQAEDRANLEIRKILYGRRMVEDTLESDGLNIDLGDRVGWVDIYDTDTSDGDISRIEGNVYHTTERIHWSDKPFFVEVTDSVGRIHGPYPASRVPGNDFSFSADIPGVNFLIPDYIDTQSGSKYFIGETNDISISDFVVVSKAPQARKGNSTDSVTVKMATYDPRLYEMDGLA